MSTPPNLDDSAAFALLRAHFSTARLSTYIDTAHGDRGRAVALYRWNAKAAGMLTEVIGHVEIALRNAMHNALTDRHTRLQRPRSWLDDPGKELGPLARRDIAQAVERLRRAGGPLTPGKVVAELNFGFWRYLLAARYTATLWPQLRPAFPHLPGRDRRLLEQPVAQVHLLRNRVAHHEPLLKESLTDRYDDALAILSYIDPALAAWVRTNSQLGEHLLMQP